MMARCAKRLERGSGLLELLCREPGGQAGVQHRNNSSYGHIGDGGRNAGSRYGYKSDADQRMCGGCFFEESRQ